MGWKRSTVFDRIDSQQWAYLQSESSGWGSSFGSRSNNFSFCTLGLMRP